MNDKRKAITFKVVSLFSLYASNMQCASTLINILDEFKKDIDVGLDIWIKMFQYTELRAAMMAILNITDEIVITDVVKIRYSYNGIYCNKTAEVVSYTNGKYGCSIDGSIEYFFREEIEKYEINTQ